MNLGYGTATEKKRNTTIVPLAPEYKPSKCCSTRGYGEILLVVFNYYPRGWDWLLAWKSRHTRTCALMRFPIDHSEKLVLLSRANLGTLYLTLWHSLIHFANIVNDGNTALLQRAACCLRVSLPQLLLAILLISLVYLLNIGPLVSAQLHQHEQATRLNPLFPMPCLLQAWKEGWTTVWLA